MAPRGRPPLVNTHGRVQEKHFSVGNQLATFVEEFKAKVSSKTQTQGRLLEGYCKSILSNYDIILQKIPKCRRDVLLGEYFAENVSDLESIDMEDVPLSVISEQRVKNTMLTPHPSSDDLQNEMTKQSTRTRGGKSKSSQKLRSAKRTKPATVTSVKTVHREPFARITPNENVISGCSTTNNLAMMPKVVLENIVTSNEWNVATMLEKNLTSESSARRLEVFSSTGRHLVYLNENKPSVVVPNGTNSLMVITSETPIETLKMDEVTLSSLEIIHKKLWNVLQACRQ